MKNEFVVVLCTSKVEESERIARLLIEEKLVACVNISPVKSYFRWKEEFYKEKEDLLIIKTKKDIVTEVIGRLKELHSSEVPEIIALPIIDGYDKYFA